MGGRRRPPTGDDRRRPKYVTCIGVSDENEFALSDLNDEVHIEQVTAIEDSLEMMAANDDGDVFADESKHPVIWGDEQSSPEMGANKHPVIWRDKSLSPGRRVTVAPNFLDNHSEIWGDKQLFPVRQVLVSPNYRMLV
ncbi:hypothetical protein WN944_023230 [Citrus x changshan-huyou]|uniref:Uncharacterized protein n=1 Tax=Citrus x changshan-huyou TaxID=2935761 RepID=A0AAP0R1V1_9ROSI